MSAYVKKNSSHLVTRNGQGSFLTKRANKRQKNRPKHNYPVNRYFQQQRKWLHVLTTDETAVHGACPIPISSSIAEKRDLQKK